MLAKAQADSKCSAYLHAFANLKQVGQHSCQPLNNVPNIKYLYVLLQTNVISYTHVNYCVYTYSSEVPAFVLSGVASVH